MNRTPRSIVTTAVLVAVVVGLSVAAWSSRAARASGTTSCGCELPPHMLVNGASLADYFPQTR